MAFAVSTGRVGQPEAVVRRRWVRTAVVLVILALGIGLWVSLRPASAVRTRIVHLSAQRHHVCVAVHPDEPANGTATCGWIASSGIDDLAIGTWVMATVHWVRGLDNPVIEIDPAR